MKGQGGGPQYAAPSETALDLLTRLASPPLDLGVPLLAGRVRAGHMVEVAGTAQWVLGELVSHMAASVVAASVAQGAAATKLCVVDVQRAHDWGRTVHLAREAMARRGVASESSQNKGLEAVWVARCDTGLQLLCALRQVQEAVEGEGQQQHVVLLVDGMTNLFWPNKQTGRAPGRGPDVMAACVKVMRQLAAKNATVLATKLVLFPRKSVFDDCFGGGWKAGLRVALAVEDVPMTAAALGKTGPRASGAIYDSEAPDRRVAFQVSPAGCHFKSL